MKINIIGAGSVGKTLGRLIVLNKIATIGSVFSRTLSAAEKSCVAIGDGTPIDNLKAVTPADMTFITVSDDAIASVAADLPLPKGASVVHFSGVLPSTVLKNFKAASIHPLKTFAEVDQSVKTFAGTFCGVEGDAELLAVVNPIFESLGAIVFSIDPTKKPLYHAACVFAANYITTLFDAAVQCQQNAGVESEKAIDVTLGLMQGALDNLKNLRDPSKALTGSIGRGDVNALRQHIAQLQQFPDLEKLYKTLGAATLPLTKHDEKLKASIKKLCVL